MIPERSLEVLRAIVHDYIETNQPVGSKSLVERHSFGVSPATIRNDMALLEEEKQHSRRKRQRRNPPSV
jgi:heat-inducible transcriptional repressor